MIRDSATLGEDSSSEGSMHWTLDAVIVDSGAPLLMPSCLKLSEIFVQSLVKRTEDLDVSESLTSASRYGSRLNLTTGVWSQGCTTSFFFWFWVWGSKPIRSGFRPPQSCCGAKTVESPKELFSKLKSCLIEGLFSVFIFAVPSAASYSVKSITAKLVVEFCLLRFLCFGNFHLGSVRSIKP